MPDLERLFTLARDLVSVDTTSGRSLIVSHDTIASYLADAQVQVERLPGSGGDRPSVLLSRNGDGPEGLLLCGHLDTVPPGDGWSGDPLALTQRDDRWYGRGSCDMTVFCALAVELIRVATCPSPLAVLLLGDEELGALGAAALVEHWPKDRVLPKACVIGEPTSCNVVSAHTGHLKATITVQGATGHTGTPSSGRNAIACMGRVLTTIDAIRERWTHVSTPASELVPVPHPVLAPVGMTGGNAWNVIPDSASLRIGIRALPDQDPCELLDDVVESLATSLDGEQWAFDVFNNNPPLHTPPDAPAHAWLRHRLGQDEPEGAAFCSDGGHLTRIGVEPVLFGPGSIAQAHRPDEFVPIEDVRVVGSHLEAMIEAFCGVPA
jgi:acetylornithine deacetylase